MTRRDDEIKELVEWKQQQQIEEGIRNGVNRRMWAICGVISGGMISIASWIGAWLNNHFPQVKVGVRAFLDAWKAGS